MGRAFRRQPLVRGSAASAYGIAGPTSGGQVTWTDVADDSEGAAIHKGKTLERGSVSTGIDGNGGVTGR